MDLDQIYAQDTTPELRFPSMAESIGQKSITKIECGEEDIQGNSCLVIDDIPVSEHKNVSVNKQPPTNMVVQDTRDMMNSGTAYSTILHSLNSKYTTELLKSASAKIANQLRLYGLVGRCVVDARGYSNCREALDASSDGRAVRASIRGIIGCQCGSIYCKLTGLKVVASEADIDDKWFDDSYVEARNVVGASVGPKEKIAEFGRVRRFAKLAEIVDAGRPKLADEKPQEVESFGQSFVGEDISVSDPFAGNLELDNGSDASEVESDGPVIAGQDIEIEITSTPIDIEGNSDSYNDGEICFDSPSCEQGQLLDVASSPDEDLVIQEGNELKF